MFPSVFLEEIVGSKFFVAMRALIAQVLFFVKGI